MTTFVKSPRYSYSENRTGTDDNHHSAVENDVMGKLSACDRISELEDIH